MVQPAKYKNDTLSLSELIFDTKNPRLAMESQESDLKGILDEQMISLLDEEADVGELITSILENNYISFEPLIVIKDGGKFRVLEGNRRLSALKLISDLELAKRCKIKIDPTLVTKEVLQSFEKITVIIVDAEEDADPLIGFKHIKGPFKWGSFAKAKFMVNRFREDNASIEELARSIGDTHNTVRKLIGGMLVLEQAIEQDLFSFENKFKTGVFGFSHLYTALVKPDFRNFLGLDKDWIKTPKINPVPDDKKSELKEMFLYLYGSKEDGKNSFINSQNPDLSDLGKVMANNEGLGMLRAGLSLSVALDSIRPDDEVLNEAIRKAYAQINHALSSASKYDGEDREIINLSEKIERGAKQLVISLKIINTEFLENQK